VSDYPWFADSLRRIRRGSAQVAEEWVRRYERIAPGLGPAREPEGDHA
jgi:hypothetical protein